MNSSSPDPQYDVWTPYITLQAFYKDTPDKIEEEWRMVDNSLEAISGIMDAIRLSNKYTDGIRVRVVPHP